MHEVKKVYFNGYKDEDFLPSIPERIEEFNYEISHFS